MESTGKWQLCDFINNIDKLIEQVEDGLMIRDVLGHEDGRTEFNQLHNAVDNLQRLVTRMREKVESQKTEYKQLKENLTRLKSLDKDINPLMTFALNSLSVHNTSASSNNSNPIPAKDENKENAPSRKAARKQKDIPALNVLEAAEFQKVPKYTKSHLTLEQVNAGIAEINIILSKKYELLNRPRKTLTLKDDRQRAVYLEQAKDLKGTCYSTFFVDEDIQRFGSNLKLKRKTKDTVFLILRHLGRMKEMHRGKLTRYTILCT